VCRDSPGCRRAEPRRRPPAVPQDPPPRSSALLPAGEDDPWADAGQPPAGVKLPTGPPAVQAPPPIPLCESVIEPAPAVAEPAPAVPAPADVKLEAGEEPDMECDERAAKRRRRGDGPPRGAGDGPVPAGAGVRCEVDLVT
jgi:hypothetical protein